MKGRLGFFIFGLFIGALLTVFIFLVYTVGYTKMQPTQNTTTSAPSNENTDVKQQIDGLNIFETEGNSIPAKQIRVFQTLGKDYALAQLTNEEFEYIGGYDYSSSIVVLLISDGNISLYDDMTLDIGFGKKVVQIGTYRYQTINKEYDQWKTVPVVMIKNLPDTETIASFSENEVTTSQQIKGLDIFDKESEPVVAKQLKIFQTINSDYALAKATNNVSEYGDAYNYLESFVVLLKNNGNKTFYDDMKIDIPVNKKLIQIGTYKYEEFFKEKTVPVVTIK